MLQPQISTRTTHGSETTVRPFPSHTSIFFLFESETSGEYFFRCGGVYSPHDDRKLCVVMALGVATAARSIERQEAPGETNDARNDARWARGMPPHLISPYAAKLLVIGGRLSGSSSDFPPGIHGSSFCFVWWKRVRGNERGTFQPKGDE